MVIWLKRFNLNLLSVLLLLAFGAGCQTTDKKPLATLRVHVEVNPDGTDFNKTVLVYRANPIPVNIQTSEIVSEANVVDAKVVDVPGGFMLRVQFDNFGRTLLEQYSYTNPQKHFAIFSQFGEKLQESRWLAAPQINRRIRDGVLLFTPDCTREEAEKIVAGLNNVAEKTGLKPKVKKGG